MSCENELLSNPKQLLRAIVLCLQQILSQAVSDQGSKSIFNLRSAPNLTIPEYLRRLFTHMHCSLSVFIYALILIDRAQEYQVDFRVNSRNLHRLLISAHMVAAKYLDDRYFKNSYYAGVGGVSVSAINLLELEFLTLINFNAHVSQATFDSYALKLKEFVDINSLGADSNPSVLLRVADKENIYEHKPTRKMCARGDRQASGEEDLESFQTQ